MKHLLRRLRDWVVGPGGWLIDSNLDDQLSAVDFELELEERIEQAERDNAWPLTYTKGVGGGWHFETGKPWPKHTKPHRLGEDYPRMNDAQYHANRAVRFARISRALAIVAILLAVTSVAFTIYSQIH